MKFPDGFAGEVLRPGDPGYDEARVVWNGMIDRRPALIVRPTTTSDVSTAIRFARERELLIGVRAAVPACRTLACATVCSSISHGCAAPEWMRRRAPRAWVAAHCWPSSTTRRSNTVSCDRWVWFPTPTVGGLTLGGGMGRLQRRFGLAIDNLLAVELVTADGRLIRASEDEHPELFWGMRGAGANFGIVTAFEFGLHPLDGPVTHGVVMHPIERAEALAER